MIKQPPPSILKYKRAFFKAQQFLNTVGVSFFPFDVFKIPKLLRDSYGIDVLICSQNEYADFARATGSKSKQFKNGLCIYDITRNVYLILYNERHLTARIRFTIMHELGHIILEHLNDEETELARGGLPNAKYLFYEGEANTFAGNALAPPIIIRELLGGMPFNCREVQDYFKLSASAVRDYRERDYSAWLRMKHNDFEFELLNRCRPQIHICVCPACRAIFFNRDANYCVVCGHNKLSKCWSDDSMRYNKIDLDSESRALICPRCGNEEIIGGEYCQICGAQIVNRCENAFACGCLAEGDARYCHLCGSKTTFFTSGLLQDWETEREMERQGSAENAWGQSDDFPF